MKKTALLLMVSLVTSITRVALAEPTPSPAQQEYARRRVDVLQLTGVSSHGYVYSVTQPVLGVHQTVLETPEFFDAVDRPDLAQRYRRGQSRRAGFAATGALGLALGLPMSIAGGAFWSMRRTHAPLSLVGSKAMTGVGIGVFAVGVAFLVAAGRIVVPTVTPDEIHALADDHNLRLRNDLGLPSISPPIATF